jgi:hypothetical protein
MEQTHLSKSQKDHNFTKATLLYRFNGVPVVAQPDFWPAPIMLSGLLIWLAGFRHPERNWLQRVGIGLLAMPFALLADLGHAMAHTISARVAGAPMNEIRLSSGMPRTLYDNNEFPPQTHIKRALGGPIFSAGSFMVSLFWRHLSPKRSVSRYLADVSLACHSMILLGSIVPLPMVDGGTVLKWKLVEAGRSPEQADQAVQKTSLGIGAACLGLGAVVGLFTKRRLAVGLLVAGGAAGIAAGKRWIK